MKITYFQYSDEMTLSFYLNAFGPASFLGSENHNRRAELSVLPLISESLS